MQVTRLFARDDQPATSPFPTTNGFRFELRGGDVCDPYGDPDGWFKPEKPKFLLRFFCPVRILPYLSGRLGRYGFYFGFKIYGMDSEAYIGQLAPKEEVYEGSLAMCLTFRFSTTLK